MLTAPLEAAARGQTRNAKAIGVLVIADGGIESDDAIGFGGCRGSCELNGNHQRLSNS
jgi:hypothetical protein